MSKLRPRYNLSISFFIFLMLSLSGLSVAQKNEKTIPDNAHSKPYGRGWECNSGYRVVDNTCLAIKLPDNAYLTHTSYGTGWKCSWGFTELSGTCIAINIPPNAYLDSFGQNWKCNRGYKEYQGTCIAIKIPVNGYFADSSYGKGWKCERGFRAHNGACLVVELPENAHIDSSGHGWDCNAPYIKQQMKCEIRNTTQ